MLYTHQYAFRSADGKAITSADVNFDVAQATAMKRSSWSRIAIILLIFVCGLARQSKGQNKRINDDANIVTVNLNAGAIRSVAFSPNGRMLATGCHDRTVKLLNLGAGKAKDIATLRGHTVWVGSVAFSPDGRQLVSCDGQTVRLWDLANGRLVRTLDGHDDGVAAVAFGPDGKRLASASFDLSVKVWDAESGNSVLALKGHKWFVKSVAFAGNRRLLASGSDDQTAIIWDLTTGKAVSTLKGHTDWVTGVAFSPNTV